MPESAESVCPRCGSEVESGDEERFCRNVWCGWEESYPSEHIDGPDAGGSMES